MLDIATISTIVTTASSAVGLIDKIVDSYLMFRGKQSAPKEHRAKIEADAAGEGFIRREHGEEVQRVSYQEMTARLDDSDLSYIQALEKSMNTHKAVWESAYPSLASEVNPVAKAKIQQQLDQVAQEMEKDLIKILTFVEKTGLYLDDHYMSVRDIAAGESGMF